MTEKCRLTDDCADDSLESLMAIPLPFLSDFSLTFFCNGSQETVSRQMNVAQLLRLLCAWSRGWLGTCPFCLGAMKQLCLKGVRCTMG
jgi:hypothetical protein